MMTQRRVALITGARGFIGAYCLPLLAQRGFEIVAVSSALARAAQSGIEWRCCDLLDPTACRALVLDVRPTHLLHLAWFTKPGAYWTSHCNLKWLGASVGLVDTFYAAGGQRAVGVGSCAEYAIPERPCVEDATPINPATIYGKVKAAMNLALEAAAYGRGTYAWGRVFVLYGPGDPPDRFISSAIRGVLRREPLSCTDGKQLRDFVFVSDVAAACVALLESDQSGAYNIASGRSVSLRNVADLITGELGGAEFLRFGTRPAPAYDPPVIVGDIGKISRDIGWQPRVELKEGLHRVIEFIRRESPVAQQM